MMKTQAKRREKGFTLFEVILVIGIAATVILGLFVVFNTMTERAAYRQIARYMTQVQNAAEEYVDLNYDTIIGSLTVDSAQALAFSDIKTAGLLPSGFAEVTLQAQDVEIFIYRSSTAPNTLQVITATNGDRLLDNEILIEVAKAGGTRFGIISDFLDFSGNISGYFGTWSVALADVAPTYAPDSTSTTGGYIATYGTVGSGIIGDGVSPFLFRVDVPDDDAVAGSFTRVNELNTMYTNLIMNGYDVEDVNILSVDRLQALGVTDIQNTQGRTNAVLVDRHVVLEAGTATVNVSDNISLRGDAQDGGLTLPDLDVGSIDNLSGAGTTIQGNITLLNAGPLAFGNLVGAGPTSTGNGPLIAPAMTLGTIDVTGDVVMGTGGQMLETASITANQVMTVNSANATTVNAVGAVLSGAQVNISDSLNYNGNNLNVVNILDIQGDVSIGGTDTLTVQEIEIDRLGSCILLAGGSC